MSSARGICSFLGLGADLDLEGEAYWSSHSFMADLEKAPEKVMGEEVPPGRTMRVG